MNEGPLSTNGAPMPDRQVRPTKPPLQRRINECQLIVFPNLKPNCRHGPTLYTSYFSGTSLLRVEKLGFHLWGGSRFFGKMRVADHRTQHISTNAVT